jgi:hypothetical protein
MLPKWPITDIGGDHGRPGSRVEPRSTMNIREQHSPATVGDPPPSPDEAHRRPAGVSDDLVDAVGKVSEALEWVERARGRLYDFHQMLGRADLLLGEAVDALADAGAADQAKRLDEAMVGRNVLEGRWTFQIMEEFDDGYWTDFRREEQRIRDELMDGKRHLFESEMKERRRTRGRPDHEARPAAGS